MRRRDFVAGLGTACVAGGRPLSVAAQAALPVVGFINSASPGPFAHLSASFRTGLVAEGFTEGRNILIEERWAEGRYERLPAFLQEFGDKGVAVVAATGGAIPRLTTSARIAKVPIVFVMGGDPVRSGLVASLSHPGGNVTGITQLTTELAAKRLGLLHELVPGMKRVAVLINPEFPDTAVQLQEIEAASGQTGLQPLILRAASEEQFGPAFAIIEQERPDALLVGADPFFNSRREYLVARIGQLRIPTIYEFREFAEAGGLISYGTDLADAYRLVGIYVGRVLKGARAAELPVLQAAKFELVINLKAAKELGLEVPPSLLARADEVIE